MSHLDAFLAGKYSHDGYVQAVRADWLGGEPIEVGDDGNGMGKVEAHRWIGYVGVTAGDRKLSQFRAVPTANHRRRRVYAIDSEGRAFYVGMLARRVKTPVMALPAAELRHPHPDQAKIDADSAALLRATDPNNRPTFSNDELDDFEMRLVNGEADDNSAGRPEQDDCPF